MFKANTSTTAQPKTTDTVVTVESPSFGASDSKKRKFKMQPVATSAVVSRKQSASGSGSASGSASAMSAIPKPAKKVRKEKTSDDDIAAESTSEQDSDADAKSSKEKTKTKGKATAKTTTAKKSDVPLDPEIEHWISSITITKGKLTVISNRTQPLADLSSSQLETHIQQKLEALPEAKQLFFKRGANRLPHEPTAKNKGSIKGDVFIFEVSVVRDFLRNLIPSILELGLGEIVKTGGTTVINGVFDIKVTQIKNQRATVFLGPLNLWCTARTTRAAFQPTQARSEKHVFKATTKNTLTFAAALEIVQGLKFTEDQKRGAKKIAVSLTDPRGIESLGSNETTNNFGTRTNQFLVEHCGEEVAAFFRPFYVSKRGIGVSVSTKTLRMQAITLDPSHKAQLLQIMEEIQGIVTAAGAPEITIAPLPQNLKDKLRPTLKVLQKRGENLIIMRRNALEFLYNDKRGNDFIMGDRDNAEGVRNAFLSDLGPEFANYVGTIKPTSTHQIKHRSGTMNVPNYSGWLSILKEVIDIIDEIRMEDSTAAARTSASTASDDDADDAVPLSQKHKGKTADAKHQGANVAVPMSTDKTLTAAATVSATASASSAAAQTMVGNLEEARKKAVAEGKRLGEPYAYTGLNLLEFNQEKAKHGIHGDEFKRAFFAAFFAKKEDLLKRIVAEGKLDSQGNVTLDGIVVKESEVKKKYTDAKKDAAPTNSTLELWLSEAAKSAAKQNPAAPVASPQAQLSATASASASATTVSMALLVGKSLTKEVLQTNSKAAAGAMPKVAVADKADSTTLVDKDSTHKAKQKGM